MGFFTCPISCVQTFALPQIVKKGLCWRLTYEIYQSHTWTIRHIYIQQLTAGYNIPTVSIYICLILLRFMLICVVSTRKEWTLVNALFHKSHTQPLSSSGFLQDECICKNNNIFWNTCNYLRLFLYFCRKRGLTHKKWQTMTTYHRFFNYDKAFDYQCELVDGMKRWVNRNNHFRIIAKPALILSIINLKEKGKLLTSLLTKNRTKYVKRYLASSSSSLTSIISHHSIIPFTTCIHKSFGI